MTSAPDAPAAALAVFGARLPMAESYALALVGEAIVRGLIGPHEGERIWTRHLLNSAVMGELIPRDCAVVDVGSGAGLPGVPLAIARPDLAVTLIEPLERRSAWLADIVARLHLTNVDVRRGRAEDFHGELTAPVVTARAVAPLPRLARWCLPLVASGGDLLAIKGRSAATELAAASGELGRLGARAWMVCTAGAVELSEPTSVIRVVAR